MTTIHPLTGEPCESAECPYCHQTFYAPPLRDALKSHIEYCEMAPAPEPWEIVTPDGTFENWGVKQEILRDRREGPE